MNALIGSPIEHQGKRLIIGHGGRLYAPHTSVDAWDRTRHTQKVTKYRLVVCGCGCTFIAHDARMKTCPHCQARIRQERRAAETSPRPAPCVVCGQPLTAQRRTKTYCSRACQQKAYRQRGSKGF